MTKRIILLITTAMVLASLAGCGWTQAKRIEWANDPAHGFSDTEKAAILNQEVFVGMSKAALFGSWGPPSRVNKTTTGHGIREQWVYGSGKTRPSRYVYIEDGTVTAIQH